jgi:hypothetical protein
MRTTLARQEGRVKRYLTMAAMLCLLLSPGCGTSPGSAAAEGYVTRDLKTGEHLTLQCGLSLVVPPSYYGYYAAGGAEIAGDLDGVSSSSTSDDLMYSFRVSSLTPDGEGALAGPFHWPLVARSADRRTEVRCAVLHPGTADAHAYISVVVRLPGRATGLVLLDALGKRASDEPKTVIGQLQSMWTRFQLTGAELPVPEG